MTKVLYVQGVSEIGGAERELLLWLQSLDRRKIAPHVALSGKGPLEKKLRALRVPYARVALPAWRKILHAPLVPLAIVSLIRLVKKWNITLIHVNDYWWAPVTIIVAHLLKCPCVVHVRQQIEITKIEKYWLRTPQLVIPVSQNVAQVLQEGGVPADRLQVLFSGIPDSLILDPPGKGYLRKKIGLDSNRLVIGTVANLFPRKGLEFLIEAFSQVHKVCSTSALIIVGKGDIQYEHALKECVTSLSLTESVFFLGFEPKPETCIVDFDVFVLSSILEGFGIVLLEAMALGKPVVATRVGGIPEIVNHEQTGLLVPPGDTVELGRALLSLLQDAQIRDVLGENGKQRVKDRFLLDHMLDGLSNIYARVS